MIDKAKVFTVFGAALLLMAVLVNEWTLGITNIALRGVVFGFDLLLIFAGGMILLYKEKIFNEIVLLFGTLLFLFVFIEGYYRIFDPFPYFGPWEINQTEHGNLSRYDDVLGWSGVPHGKEELVMKNSKSLLRLNSLGFRDIEHTSAKKPAIVFLGDSFTWGFEVEFEDMFVNMLRKKMPDVDVYNLAHRGYGTDQELLTFRRWDYRGDLRLVVLMFCENDFRNNSRTVEYEKQKPMFELRDGVLTLTNVPVPSDEKWQQRKSGTREAVPLKERIMWALFRSHFLHDIYYRIELMQETPNAEIPQVKKADHPVMRESHSLTTQIISELNKEVQERGGRLVVVAIPSKEHLSNEEESTSYRTRVKTMCRDLKIGYLDLWPYFKRAHARLYFRLDGHTNRSGNAVIMKAIYRYLNDRKDETDSDLTNNGDGHKNDKGQGHLKDTPGDGHDMDKL